MRHHLSIVSKAFCFIDRFQFTPPWPHKLLSSIAGEVDNIPNKPFSCTICAFEHEDISEVSNHIETLHAIKYRICLIRAQQMIANDERERSQIIRLLGRFDKPTIPLYIRFNYWD